MHSTKDVLGGWTDADVVDLDAAESIELHRGDFKVGDFHIFDDDVPCAVGVDAVMRGEAQMAVVDKHVADRMQFAKISGPGTGDKGRVSNLQNGKEPD